MTSIQGLILTYNEEANIDRSLKALDWIDAVLIVDSFSDDRTIDIADSFPNVSLEQRKFDSHAQQWNYGLDALAAKWVLSLDADYVVTPELRDEIQSLVEDDSVAGYEANFAYVIGGRRLRASAYPSRVVLFRKDSARYFDEGHTQQLRMEGKVGQLQGLIEHDDRKPLSRWIVSQDKYAKLEAEHLLEMLKRGKAETLKREGKSENGLNFADRLRLMIFVAPIVMPVYLLFARGLILDGWRGGYYVLQRTIAEMLLSLRLLDAKWESGEVGRKAERQKAKRL